ncbi:hypothetical protein BU16DRAFT_560319 [Lophium mytilinum]|uniref:Uncharacterized protein n=1 Tax=Lophium mytilinum TaxID=390894 RepID=A0A6A6QY22_9PEZI|nr:hypothetical protein BU16DRAFT_560319 [Lophium mytilinum]
MLPAVSQQSTVPSMYTCTSFVEAFRASHLLAPRLGEVLSGRRLVVVRVRERPAVTEQLVGIDHAPGSLSRGAASRHRPASLQASKPPSLRLLLQSSRPASARAGFASFSKQSHSLPSSIARASRKPRAQCASHLVHPIHPKSPGLALLHLSRLDTTPPPPLPPLPPNSISSSTTLPALSSPPKPLSRRDWVRPDAAREASNPARARVATLTLLPTPTNPCVEPCTAKGQLPHRRRSEPSTHSPPESDLSESLLLCSARSLDRPPPTASPSASLSQAHRTPPPYRLVFNRLLSPAPAPRSAGRVALPVPIARCAVWSLLSVVQPVAASDCLADHHALSCSFAPANDPLVCSSTSPLLGPPLVEQTSASTWCFSSIGVIPVRLSNATYILSSTYH